MKSSGAPSLRNAMSRAQSGTQSYALVASKKQMCVSVFFAWLLWVRFAIMSRGACGDFAKDGSKIFGLVSVLCFPSRIVCARGASVICVSAVASSLRRSWIHSFV